MVDERRTEGVPSLTARRNWGRYAVGMAVEVSFILVLMAVGLGLALLGMAVWG